tara:strand:- start:266 stop:1840 length:1575 start_codon:yes stop_codon:yes gene_type:complete
MSLRASASSFVPGKMNPNVSSFVPQMPPSILPDSFESSAKNIQRRFRGNRSRNLTQRRNPARINRPIDYDVQRKIMNRYILNDEYDDLEQEKDILEYKINRGKVLKKDRIDEELKRIPSREDRISRGMEEQRLRHRRARTKRSMGYMRNLPEDQRPDNIRERVDAMTDAEQEEIIEDYNDVLESGSSDEELYSDDEDDMKIKENRRRDLEYYREQEQLEMDEDGPIMHNEIELGELEEKLEGIKKMDIVSCKRVRQMVEADPRLFRDKKFYEMYIKPCKDETTEVYLDTFFNINWQWIKPIGINWRTITAPRIDSADYRKYNDHRTKEEKRFRIEEAIIKIPGKYYPRSCKIALIDCLMELELLSERFPVGPPFIYIDVLANFFKFINGSAGTRISLRRLKFGNGSNYSIVSRGLSGREELDRLFDLFEDTILSRELKHSVVIDGIKRSILIDAEKIEQMKRYFILLLIGVVQNPTYIEQLVLLRFIMPANKLDKSKGYTKEDLTLQEDIKKLDDWIEGVEYFF